MANATMNNTAVSGRPIAKGTAYAAIAHVSATSPETARTFGDFIAASGLPQRLEDSTGGYKNIVDAQRFVAVLTEC